VGVLIHKGLKSIRTRLVERGRGRED